jgi:hypothetical protein
MASRRLPEPLPEQSPRPQRWMSLVLCALSLLLMTCG